ncbi:hypothetical protein R1sor_000653 [Riccia sorocarpa]|uniref:Uncharacterized protein n=1 Tax=Riccia sorocarpa TaxID=122646 RepID=A0ABD3GXW8_9MARC
MVVLDKVVLKVKGRVVALAAVESRDEAGVCQGKILGPGRVKVAILTVFDSDCMLPYPTLDATTIQEAINSYVMWDASETLLVESSSDSHMERLATSSSKTEVVMMQGDSESGERREAESDLEKWKNRDLWIGQHVRILSKGDNPIEIAKAKILYSDPQTNIEGNLLGEEFAGVVVLFAGEQVDDSLVRAQIPNYASGHAQLCRWQINLLRLEENGRILGDLYVRVAEGDLVIYSPPKSSLSQKRTYNSIRRKLITQEDRGKIAGEKRCVKKCDDEDIRRSMVRECCRQGCGTKWAVDDIKEVRTEIYGVHFEKKLDLLYQKLNASTGRSDGMILFSKGRFVCQKAFWQLHGISKSCFYNHRTNSNNGAKQGYHGNKGSIKPRELTMESIVFMKILLKEMGEPMPHVVFDNNRRNETDSVSYRLPACYDKKDVFEELCIRINQASSLPPSRAKFYEEWKSNFANYDFHKKSAFAVCTPCEKYKIWLTRERNDELRRQYEAERQQHLQLQMSGRTNYYTHNRLATDDPLLYKSAIHDGMDSGKTAIPKQVNYVKALAGVGMPLPLKVAGILNRGMDQQCLLISLWGGEDWEDTEGRPLKHGFWPRTNHVSGYQRPEEANDVQDRQRIEDDLLMREAEEELLERNQVFVGNPIDREPEHFAPILNIQVGVMLLIRPLDQFPVKNSIWVAKAITSVVREIGSDRFNQLKVQWYRPKHRFRNASEEQRYALCMRNNQEWEKDPTMYEEEQTFVYASACVYCWTCRAKSDKLRLTPKGLETATLMIQHAAEEDP